VITHGPKVGLEKIQRCGKKMHGYSGKTILLIFHPIPALSWFRVGHEIQTDKPEVVVNAIKHLVTQWRDEVRR
jgi:hypothetical protein